ncbi:MAG: P-loop NTPase fold protein [Aquabacterium sp.]|uniref:KAP family P-loop NTPase fold protein n=1 Tax=Aquabacterium sp. TaxID=1872578 RepID=UPI0027189183|nr:P-loop NTPase fold protein [Aquabacterium sp.]MDO9006459.1 P-loop NTPase fold protein [Aquabacterium sp.]
MTDATSAVLAQWEGDLLGRKASADFLHRLVLQKMTSKGGEVAQSAALCFALDSAWGTGKTFFLKHWAEDLRNCDHPVIEFDAWQNDLAEEPLVGFLAELRNGLDPWVQKVPVAKKARAEAKKKFGELLQRGRKAILPAAGIAVKSYLSSKIDLDGVVGAFKSGGLDQPEMDIEAAKDAVGKGLDRLFEQALDSHDETKQAVKDFKGSLDTLLHHLEAHAEASLPLFILIDELDRCRPDYAVRLLEGIKHLFDAPGVCFVVSTNLPQMAESVRAVYGNGFDGYQYLKRFFAFEYQLPKPSRSAYCEALAREYPALSARSIATGLPSPLTASQNRMEIVATHLDVIGSAFGLSLRSLRQVAFIAEAAVAGIDTARKVFLLHLLMLAAVLHRSPKVFTQITQSKVVRDKYKPLLDEAGFENLILEFQTARQGYLEREKVSISSAFTLYHEWSFEDLKTLRGVGVNNSANSRSYPSTLLTEIVEEMPNPHSPEATYLPSIRIYPDLLRAAGYLSS